MELIKITDHNGNKAVSARELYQFLESKQQFSDWIQNRIRDYGFIEGQDFEVFHNSMKNPSGGRPTLEYAISLDMAKELSMVERTEKGKQARRYFIECEKRLIKSCQTPLIPIKEHHANLLAELKKLINLNLYKDDIRELAGKYDIEVRQIRRVLNGKGYDSDILKVSYQKAMENKLSLREGVKLMIDNLKA
ncbi:antA/AntB antirepressor family protein [Bergeyella sp. RCAD1439]|uniref:antA/AntB antirepressor family protein n=1 Tax=Bergeyella anatis TaxID=3113737 RepID=UPI002E174D81|nr:antA/AntB antirepressor family protein [Bergeyella sp. RCAD1439]